MLYAFIAYFFWGLFPIYWKLLKHVPVLEILANRVLWAFVFYSLISWIKNKKMFIFFPNDRKSFLILCLASSMLMLNWVIYIWAVNSNQIIESSLGYFINPLVNIFFGITLLNEKLSKHQIISTAFAFVGIFIISYSQGHLPWIAFVLATSFSIYGLLKKKSTAASLDSNQFESMIFIIPAFIYVIMQPHDWMTSDNSLSSITLLIGSGIVTGLPLILFAKAAKKIPYYMMGFFQFLTPTLQFASGIILFHEPLSHEKIIGFAFIWLGILYLVITEVLKNRNKIKS